jgi:hypothetical protein
MLDILRDYVASTATPELYLALEQAHNSFERIGLNNYEKDFEEIVMTDRSDDVDTGDTLILIERFTRQCQEKILAEHGVQLREDSSIDLMRALIDGILTLQNYENPTDIQRVLESDGGAEEKFADLMSFVTEYTSYEVVTAVEIVDAALLARIGEQNPEVDEPQDQEALDARERHLRLLRALCSMLGTTQLVVAQFLRDGLDTGYPFEVYFNLAVPHFKGMDGKLIAQELLAMAVLSSDGVDNPVATIQPKLDDVSEDLTEVTRTNIALRDLIVNFEKFQVESGFKRPGE